MANFGKKPNQKKKRLGHPPPIKDVSTTLGAPEHAPVLQTRKARGKTGRTIPFGTKVTTEFNKQFREAAFRAKLKHSELLEIMLDQYEERE